MTFNTKGRMITEEIISKMERRKVLKTVHAIIKYVTYEIFRFLILILGVGAFVFVEVPLMEANAERSLLICELLIAILFALWFGSFIYDRKNKR